MNNIASLITLISPLFPIIKALQQEGAVSYLVGGCVRDLVLGIDIKDIDIEVHGQAIEQVQKVLERFGEVSLIGKQFGVLRIHGIDVDWSLPRRDSQGRKPVVTIDPHLTFKEAARRRDITMNAMGINLNHVVEQGANLSSLEIVDPYDGLKAIADKKLSAVDTALFLEDPLRFFRVMQFIGRFEMQPDEALQQLCTTMELRDAGTQTPIARERIEEEIKKLFLKSYYPSLGFRWLAEIDRLEELFPELYALIGLKQSPKYHPEGDAFEHTMQALDAAAQLTYRDEQEKVLLMLAALCHDLGKAVTTDEQLHAYNHDREGVPLAQRLLYRFTHDYYLINGVSKLVMYHMRPLLLVAGGAKASAYKRLASHLSPDVSMYQLALLSLADKRGRNPLGPEPLQDSFDELDEFLKKTEQAAVMHKPEPPALLGRDLIGDIEPGPAMGALLKKAYEIQIEEGIIDPLELKKRVL